MKTLILGGGAVGSTLGAYLAAAGRDVTIADGWFAHIEAVRRDGLHVQAVEGDFVAKPTALHLDDLGTYGTADLIIVAPKAYDTRLFALLAREHLHGSTIVMSSQNGMNDELVGAIVGPERMIACVVALGADLHEAGAVRRSSAADVTSIVLGHLENGRDRAVLDRLHEHFEPLGGVRVADDAWPERWGKLMLNSMSNALAGLTGLWSDKLWSEPTTLDIIIALGHETAAVAAAAGVDASAVLGRIPHRLMIAADSVTGEAWAEVADLMRAISAERVGKRANRASLLQDVMKGRRTEVDYLNGWIARRGEELGVSTPTHLLLVRELHHVQSGERPAAIANAGPIAAKVAEWYA